MGKIIRASAFSLAAAFTSVAWSQVVPDLIDNTGRSIGQYVGDSVLVLYSGQVVRIYLDPDWNYSTGGPASSGLSWRYVPVYYQSLDCSGQAYIGGSLTEPALAMPLTGQPAPTPGTVPAYSSPAYGSHFMFAPSKLNNAWIAYVSWENPNFVPAPMQSVRQWDGSCAQKSYPVVWVTPVITQVGLDIYGVPPFYAR